MTEPLVVRRETHIAAPPATVFAFLTDREKILSYNISLMSGSLRANRE
jgi:uncharacterized protein YndB with AHSA1/START domain